MILVKLKFTSIDFTDMLYLPIIKPFLIGEGYDRVLLDESQDTNDCQRAFIEWLLKPDARLISVGDSKQSIYSFAGANIDSFKNIQQRPNTKVFTLPVSHRCSKNVVKFAQGIYDTIQYSDYAIDGDVRLGSYLEIQEGDMVLSRTTLPLVYLFFLLVDRGVKASIIGKDIEVGLIEFAKKIKASSFEQVNKNMDNQLNELAKELKESGFIKPEKHNKYINLVEKIQVISLILNKIDNSLHLEDKIHQIFAENKKAARLMSIHRSKGLEEKRVFVIESFKGKQLIPSEYAVQEHEKIQERNLSFVAYTRAKEDILLLDI